MPQVQIAAESLKAIVKEAVAEALEKQREVLYEAVAEALEDIAMSHATREGDRGDYVSRDEIFSILESPA